MYRGETLGDTVIGWQGTKPESSVLYQVNQGNPRKALEGQSPVSASSAILDCLNVSFDFRNMLISSSHVQVWVPRSEGFEVVVSKDGIHRKTRNWYRLTTEMR
jgi:hypothetical protein